MGTPVSGKLGNVSLDAEIENVLRWTLNVEIDQHASADSDSDSWERNVGGNRRWSGTITIKSDQGKIPASISTAMLADTAMAFTGTAYTGVEYTGNVKIQAVNDIGADIQSGVVEEMTFPFVGDGELTPAVTS